MPAEKSKNSLPSTSVTTMPRPLFATSGYERVYDGEIYFSSPSSTRLAFGPGRAVLILGPIAVFFTSCVKVSVAMSSSAAAVSSRLPVVSKCNLGTRESWFGHTQSKATQRRMKELIATEKTRAQPRRKVGAIPPWTHQAVQPALGRLEMRVGILLQHRKRATSLLIIAGSRTQRNPHFGNE